MISIDFSKVTASKKIAVCDLKVGEFFLSDNKCLQDALLQYVGKYESSITGREMHQILAFYSHSEDEYPFSVLTESGETEIGGYLPVDPGIKVMLGIPLDGSGDLEKEIKISPKDAKDSVVYLLEKEDKRDIIILGYNDNKNGSFISILDGKNFDIKCMNQEVLTPVNLSFEVSPRR